MTTIQELLDRIIYDEMKFKDLQKYSITSLIRLMAKLTRNFGIQSIKANIEVYLLYLINLSSGWRILFKRSVRKNLVNDHCQIILFFANE